MEQKQPSKEEINKIVEDMRKVALKNLSESGLMDIAASYFADNSKSGFGDTDNSAMEQFKYAPVINSGISYIDPKTGKKVENLVQNLIEKSRQEGKRYSGNISEGEIMQSCAKIAQESLDAITVQDLLKLTGSKEKVKSQFENVYLRNLKAEIPQEEYNKLSPEHQAGIQASMKTYQELVGSYQSYLTQTKVSEALGEGAKQIPKSLESILCEAPKVAKNSDYTLSKSKAS